MRKMEKAGRIDIKILKNEKQGLYNYRVAVMGYSDRL
jgi:hypothetical protein